MLTRSAQSTEIAYFIEDLLDDKVKYCTEEYYSKKGPTGYEVLEAVK